MEDITMDWILCGILILVQSASCLNPHCQWTHTDEMSCKNLKSVDLSKSIATQLEKNNIVLLNITESDIPKIIEEDFKEFNKLIELHICESQLDIIENNTFRNNLKLITLNFSNNYLQDVTGASFASDNKINTIDISNNMLTNLYNFNITQFPKLKLLILDDNGLKFLPKGVVDKLKENNEFYLSAERNPWDCNQPEWKDFLNSKLIEAFCSGEKFVYVPKSKPIARDKRMDQLKFNIDCLGEKHQENKTSTDSNHCFHCSFYFCIFWFAGGIWIGIILGNVFKLKKLLFSGPKKAFTEVGVQCEHPYIEQRKMTDLQQGKYSQNPTKQSSKVSFVKVESKEITSPDENIELSVAN